MESSASGSSKKARAPGNGTQIPSCLVDGCTSDLGKCRDYHRRHKVCELHSKTSRVTIQGQEKRFCQQCSRFHSLEEFDEGKRSCRKRLDGHNRRRRKSQPDSLSNSERFFSNAQGTKFIPFGSPELFSTSTVTPAWAGSVKAKTDMMLHNDHSQSRSQSQSHSHSLLDFSNGNLFQGSFSYNCEDGKQFPFLEGGASTLSGASSVCQPLHTANSSSCNCDSCSQKVFSEYWFNGVVDSSHALSLLSSPRPATQGIGLNRMVQANSNSLPRAQSLIPSLNYSGLGMDSEPIGSALVTDSSSNADVHGPDTFEIGPEHESPTTGTYPTLSFFWE